MTDSPQNVSECSQYAFERLNLEWSLKGAFPANSLGRMDNLRSLSVRGNELTGPIPESLGSLRLLEELNLSYNHLNGTVPVFIGQLTKLRDLDISENSLKGVITEAHFSKLSMLKYLDISSNSKLTFIVSREWKPPFQLIKADLSSSKIINGFPQWLRTQKKLSLLRLSNGSITGPLPTWLRKMPVVDSLDLSHNKLSGPLINLPNKGSVDVSNSYYKQLFLQDNLFNESIPISLCRRTDLEFLFGSGVGQSWKKGRLPPSAENAGTSAAEDIDLDEDNGKYMMTGKEECEEENVKKNTKRTGGRNFVGDCRDVTTKERNQQRFVDKKLDTEKGKCLDQEDALRNVVVKMFPDSHHRLCMWHLTEKLQGKVLGDLAADTKFRKDFHKLIWNVYIGPEVFEQRWVMWRS
ncbi:leucine-rich repeat protein [Tanacetum coccineum]